MGLGKRCFVMVGGGQGLGDSVLDLREGVCVLCVFVCVCMRVLWGMCVP